MKAEHSYSCYAWECNHPYTQLQVGLSFKFSVFNRKTKEYILNMNHAVHASAIPPAQSHRAIEQSNETTDPAPTGWKKFKKDLKNPLVAAILIFFSGVLVLGIISALIKDHLPDKSKRVPWSDNVNQVINVLFTLLNLYQHPARFQHLVFWYRWRPRDIEMLRIVYCKNGTEKRNERPHILVVILLAQAGCFSQYGIAYFNWAYPMPDRPQKSIKAFYWNGCFLWYRYGYVHELRASRQRNAL
ncbi:hypothetical protein AKJ16_DCAP18565 [Drosera capensis]